jgi:hypothetical protein
MDHGPQYKIQNSEASTGKSREYPGSNRYKQGFLNRTPAVQQLREMMGKWYYMKLNSFCTKKEMASKLKRPPQSGRKYLLVTHQTKD